MKYVLLSLVFVLTPFLVGWRELQSEFRHSPGAGLALWFLLACGTTPMIGLIIFVTSYHP